MKKLIALLLVTGSAYAYDCSIQAEFYRSLPVFLGTAGTLDISTEDIQVSSNRGRGLQTETKGNVTRYFYPAERGETHILQTKESNGDTVISSVPKEFNCNLRQVVIRLKKLISLSYCSVDGCRHLTKESCEYLDQNFSDKRIRPSQNPLGLIYETDSKLKTMTKSLHGINSQVMRDFKKFENYSPRIIGVSISDYISDEETSPTFALLKLGGIIASEAEYCQRLLKEGKFWAPDMRPSKYLKKN